MYCQECGKMISDTALFCCFCGAKVNRPQNPTGGSGHQQQQSGYPPGNYMNGRPGADIYNMTRPIQPPPGAIQMAGGAVRGGAKAAREASKIRMLAIIAAVLIAIAAMLYFLFFQAGTPEDTVAKMEDALNHMDQEALLECFDGQTQQMYSGALGLTESFSGLPLGDFSDLAAGLGGFMAGAGLTPKFTLTVLDVEYSDSDNCMVTVDFNMRFQGETEQETQMLPMKKDGRDWVISAAAMQDMFY